jgi:tRNA A22 N-methylase
MQVQITYLFSHWAIICGQTGCGKTEFVLDLLEKEYRQVFEFIVILCPTLEWNKAYKNREWIGTNKKIIIVNPIVKEEEKLQELLRTTTCLPTNNSTMRIFW